jgi:hypothetical protein
MTDQVEFLATSADRAEYFRDMYHEFRHVNDHISTLAEQPGYKVWTAALYALADEYGVTGRFLMGQSLGYCAKLIEAGADPDHLLAILVLAFGGNHEDH